MTWFFWAFWKPSSWCLQWWRWRERTYYYQMQLNWSNFSISTSVILLNRIGESFWLFGWMFVFLCVIFLAFWWKLLAFWCFFFGGSHCWLLSVDLEERAEPGRELPLSSSEIWPARLSLRGSSRWSRLWFARSSSWWSLWWWGWRGFWHCLFYDCLICCWSYCHHGQWQFAMKMRI